ncbi:MFS transporter [Fusobacteria bacterium ZRK30]|nr:MFS transporter [Fusobacteria bacterium ZRK30]
MNKLNKGDGVVKTKMADSNFVIYFAGQLVSLIGNMMEMVVFPLLILDITESGTKMGLVVGTSMITFFLFSFFTGSFVDKHPNWQKNILATSDICSGLVILGYLLLVKEVTVTNILVLVLLQNIPSSFFNSTNNTIFTRITGKENLEKITSIMSIGRNTIGVLTPLLGIFVYVHYGFKVLLIINMLTFIISGVLEYTIKVRPIKKVEINENKKKKGYKEVAKFLNTNKVLKDLTILSVIINFLFAPLLGVSLVYFVNKTLKMGSEYIGYFQTSFLLGIIIGSFIIFKLSNKFQFKSLYSELVLAQTTTIWSFYIILSHLWSFNETYAKIFYILGIIVIGILTSFMNIPMMSFLQERVEQSIKGRFFVFYNAVTGIFTPVSGAVIGVAMDNYSIKSIVTVIIFLSIVIQFYFAFKLNLRKRHKALIRL